MALLSPIEMNMDWSRTVLEAKYNNVFLDVAQKVALYTLIPFSLIAIFEAVVKNLIAVNTLNIGIHMINAGYNLYQKIFTGP